MIYKCVNKCIWDGKLRREGFLTPHLSSCPNHHFVPNGEEETINEEFYLEQDNQEQNQEQEFTEEELRSKKFNALKKIAVSKGLDTSNVSNVSGMITLIMGA